MRICEETGFNTDSLPFSVASVSLEGSFPETHVAFRIAGVSDLDVSSIANAVQGGLHSILKRQPRSTDYSV